MRTLGMRIHSLPSRVWAMLQEQGSTRPLALVRIGLAILLWAKWASYPTFRMGYAGVDNLVLAPLFFAATTLMFFGLWTHVATLVTAVAVTAIFFRTGDLHHHTYLLMAVSWMVAAGPAGRSLSLDRLRRLRGGIALPEYAPLYVHRLIAVQVSTVYLWGAMAKCNMRFASGAGLEYLWIDFMHGVWLDVPAWIFPAMALMTIAVELFLAVGLWFRRLRVFAVVVGVGLHGTFYLLWDIGTFSATMMMLYLLFWPPQQIHRAVDELAGPEPGLPLGQR